MVLVYLKARDTKLGFSVSSKVGNSVVRNRLRRRMKEDLRLLRPSLKSGKYILVARTAAKSAPAHLMKADLLSVLVKGNLMHKAADI